MHKRKLNRLSGFDYSAKGCYYITICVHNHSCVFGRIINKAMELSRNGVIAHEQWDWLGNHYQYLEIVSFIVMPDHVHCIIRINDVIEGNGHALQKIKPLPEIIGAYKTTVSKRIHQSGDLDFKWQKSYHDHIIRDSKTLDRILNYIQKNPENWL